MGRTLLIKDAVIRAGLIENAKLGFSVAKNAKLVGIAQSTLFRYIEIGENYEDPRLIDDDEIENRELTEEEKTNEEIYLFYLEYCKASVATEKRARITMQNGVNNGDKDDAKWWLRNVSKINNPEPPQININTNVTSLSSSELLEELEKGIEFLETFGEPKIDLDEGEDPEEESEDSE